MWDAFKKGFGLMFGIVAAATVIDIGNKFIKTQVKDSQENTK